MQPDNLDRRILHLDDKQPGKVVKLPPNRITTQQKSEIIGPEGNIEDVTESTITEPTETHYHIDIDFPDTTQPKP